MNAHVIVVGYKMPYDLFQFMFSINQPGVFFHVFQHSDDPELEEVCNTLSKSFKCIVYPFRRNRGLAKSWNDGLINAYELGAEVAFIANDDALAGSVDDLTLLYHAALENPQVAMVSAFGYDVYNNRHEDLLFTLAAINKSALRTVGYFDENFFPIYFEDKDWYRRMELANAQRICIDGTKLMHAGSKTLHQKNEVEMLAHHQSFIANRDYYVRKWGGESGKERYLSPFNSNDHSFNIRKYRRHRPYGEQDRSELQCEYPTLIEAKVTS